MMSRSVCADLQIHSWTVLFTKSGVCEKRYHTQNNFIEFLFPLPLLVKVGGGTDGSMRLSKKRYHICNNHVGCQNHCNFDSKGEGGNLTTTGMFKWYLFSHTPDLVKNTFRE